MNIQLSINPRTLAKWAMCSLLLLWTITATQAQTKVSGKVIDGETGEALPFVNVVFTGTRIGMVTDFDGFYSLTTTESVDSITVSYIGYEKVIKPVIKGTQTINFSLFSTAGLLEEAVIRPGVNPAEYIIRAAQKNKKDYNIDKLESYEYSSYNRVQLAIDNISDKFKKRKVFKAMESMFDTISSLSVDSAIPVVPVFVSEAISDYYFKKLPRRTKEVIHATQVKGVGVSDDSYISQVLGSTWQQYNFNQNNLYILDKDFISPISNLSWAYYVFTLMDSMIIDGKKTYMIQVNPKNKRDLVFTGTIWITDETFALKQLSLEITKDANLNFIEKLKIQQEMEEVEPGIYLPRKTRVLIDISEITANTVGMIGLYYNANKNFAVNTNRDLKFYEEKIIIDDEAHQYKDNFWDTARFEKLDQSDLKIFKMVDSLRNQPVIKTYVDLVDLAIDGYKKYEKIEYGPYAYLAGWNNLEGFRTRMGFRTTPDLFKSTLIQGYGAYGFKDKQWKYGGKVEHVISRKKWTKVGVMTKKDVELIGLTDKDYGTSVLFDNFSTLGSSQLNRATEYNLYGESEFLKGYVQSISLQHKQYEFENYGTFYFKHYTNPELVPSSPMSSSFKNTSITLEGRLSRKELFIIRRYERVGLGNYKAPVVTLSYSKGFKGILDGSFDYHKASIHVWQFNSLGNLGTFEYNIRIGKTFGTLPYPLLDVIRGNQSYFSSKGAYNMLRFYEFVTDQYISFHYEHQFNGIVFNRMPLIKKLKWREFVNVKGVFGTISDANYNLIPKVDEFGKAVTPIGKFGSVPYMEFGYGIENIFKFLRIDFIHRLTYLDHADAKPFGIKGTAVIRF
jgi:hypothetical protein